MFLHWPKMLLLVALSGVTGYNLSKCEPEERSSPDQLKIKFEKKIPIHAQFVPIKKI